MKNRWQDSEAKSFITKYKSVGEELALRTYSARLIGQDRALVLHGGGNTSVKTNLRAVTGDTVDVLCVKGSGWDLATIEPAGHPAVRMQALTGLRSLKRLSDEEMVNQLRSNMLDSTGPNPSVETLLHAFLPHKFIDHTHADAILSLVDQPEGEKRLQDWMDGKLAIVPYIMPGFALSKLAAKIFEKHPKVEGLLLLKHGIFTFGDSARESYERMIRWVDSAEKLLAKAKPVALTPLYKKKAAGLREIGAIANVLRGEIHPMIVRHRSSREILNFVNSQEAASLSQRGPATPDHVIRT